MAYDEHIAARIGSLLGRTHTFEEKKMFGGVAFMVRGHMTIGIGKDGLMVRVGKEAYEDALAQPHAREMEFTGKPMKGYVYVNPDGLQTDTDLQSWIDRSLTFNATMEAK